MNEKIIHDGREYEFKERFVNIYVVKDLQADLFGIPFFQHNDAVASRSFRELGYVKTNPQDYLLYHVGKYSEISGNLFPDDFIKKIDTHVQEDEK